MQTESRAFAIAPALIALLAASARAGNYAESISGDISNDRFNPTAIILNTGGNTITGDFGGSPAPGIQDLDYFNVFVPSGTQSKIILQSLSAGGANSFLGVSDGPIFLIPATSTDPSPLLGWNHIFANQQGADLAPSLGLGPALPAGSYTFWINETDTSQAWNYSLDFQVSAVPEPATFAMLSAAAALLAARRRRTRA